MQTHDLFQFGLPTVSVLMETNGVKWRFGPPTIVIIVVIIIISQTIFFFFLLSIYQRYICTLHMYSRRPL